MPEKRTRKRMQKSTHVVSLLLLLWVLISLTVPVSAKGSDLTLCKDFGFSTEEDFIAAAKQPDGVQLVSDGDLLSKDGIVCARNQELLRRWEITVDLGLDALDIIDVEERLIVFSTEIDDPKGRFSAGDLLATNGAVISNKALLTRFQVGRDLGLDGLQLTGEIPSIKGFLKLVAEKGRDHWLDGGLLVEELIRYKVDVLFTTEGQELKAAAKPIFDGDLLSAQTGTIIFNQPQLHVAGIPAGVPQKGVDFGLDGIALPRLQLDRDRTFFSTEILFRREPKFNDGDMLKLAAGVKVPNSDLIGNFGPKAKFLGLDALHIAFADDDPKALGGGAGSGSVYLPIVSR